MALEPFALQELDNATLKVVIGLNKLRIYLLESLLWNKNPDPEMVELAADLVLWYEDHKAKEKIENVTPVQHS